MTAEKKPAIGPNGSTAPAGAAIGESGDIVPAARRRLGFLPVDGFSMIALTAAIEPLRGANLLLEREAYRYQLIAPGARPTRASSGLMLGTDLPLETAADALEDLDALLVVTGVIHEPENAPTLHALLRRAARRGLIIGSISAGAFVLARAGLLNGYRCTVHWEYQGAFEETFPEIECSPGLFVIDRTRWTGSGGISSMDMMLHMIAADHGATLARRVANNFQVDRIRNAGIEQRPGALEILETLPEPMQRVVALMRANIESPMSMNALANTTGLNLRRIERMFQSHLGESPGQFYRRLRLQRARELLMHTNLSALEAAMMTGFSSSSHFAMAYQRQHGIRPSETRRAAKPGGVR
ncbi:MAG: GlxA family transcriptional regulator [Pseudomonadota bacterium]